MAGVLYRLKKNKRGTQKNKQKKHVNDVTGVHKNQPCIVPGNNISRYYIL